MDQIEETSLRSQKCRKVNTDFLKDGNCEDVETFYVINKRNKIKRNTSLQQLIWCAHKNCFSLPLVPQLTPVLKNFSTFSSALSLFDMQFHLLFLSFIANNLTFQPISLKLIPFRMVLTTSTHVLPVIYFHFRSNHNNLDSFLYFFPFQLLKESVMLVLSPPFQPLLQ